MKGSARNSKSLEVSHLGAYSLGAIPAVVVFNDTGYDDSIRICSDLYSDLSNLLAQVLPFAERRTRPSNSGNWEKT